VNTDERINYLETQFSYQDRLIQDLNEVIITQQRQLDAQQLELQRIRALLLTTDNKVCRPENETPPPHY